MHIYLLTVSYMISYIDIEGTVKFEGVSVILWGCMLWDGPGYAYRIDGVMIHSF